MRIFQRAEAKNNKSSIIGDLEQLANSSPISEPVCGNHCNKYKEIGCHRYCSDAPTMLSSELDKYPLEEKITPLVFELKRIGFFTPCWSCEGHLDQNGKLWKIPRVWFYVSSLAHVRVLVEAIKNMGLDKKLITEWEIKLIPSEENNLDTRFSLQPVVGEGDFSLEEIQKDIDTIAENIYDDVSQQAKKLVTSLD